MSLQKSPSLVESEFQNYMDHYSKSSRGVSPDSRYETSPVVKASQPQFNTNDLGGNFDLSDVSPVLSSSPSIKERAALFSGNSVSSSSSTPGSITKHMSTPVQSQTPAFSSSRPSSSVPPLKSLDLRPPSQIMGSSSTPNSTSGTGFTTLQRVQSSQHRPKPSFGGGPPPGGVAAMSPIMQKLADPLDQPIDPHEFSTHLQHCYEEVLMQVDNGIDTLRKLVTYVRKFGKASALYVQAMSQTTDHSFVDEFTQNMRNHIDFHKANQHNPQANRRYSPNYDRCAIVLGTAAQIEELNQDYGETVVDFAAVIDQKVLPILTNTLRDCEQTRKPLSLEPIKSQEQVCLNDKRNLSTLLFKADQVWRDLVNKQREVEKQKEDLVPTRQSTDNTDPNILIKRLDKSQKEVRELETKAHRAFKALDQGLEQYHQSQQKLIPLKTKLLDALQGIEHKRLLALNQALPIFEQALKSLVMFKNSSIDFAFGGHPLSSLVQGFSTIELNRDIRRYILELQKIKKEEPVYIEKPCELNSLVQSDLWKQALSGTFTVRGLVE